MSGHPLARLSALLVLLSVRVAVAAPFTVAIDPGHGGEKEGARSPAGVLEKDVVLAVAQQLAVLLEADGAKVLLTRNADVDVPLDERTRLANAARADVLVSIHCNSMPTDRARRSTHGVETYLLSADATDAEAREIAERENADVSLAEGPAAFDPISLILSDLSRSLAHADSSQLAVAVQSALVEGTGAKTRGVRQAPFIVLLGAEMPAVLVEIGFISHPEEGARLAEAGHQRKVAKALLEGLRVFRDTVYARRSAPPVPVVEEAMAPAAPARDAEAAVP